MRKHLLEESYEAISAIDSGDFVDMREEFGDLLLQIVLQSQIANEEGQFNVNQVVQGIHSKIVQRHPHVFGELELDDVDGVLVNWENLKEKERGKKKNGKGLLDGVPLALPALSQAQEYQDRAARVGFDWPEIECSRTRRSSSGAAAKDSSSSRACSNAKRISSPAATRQSTRRTWIRTARSRRSQWVGNLQLDPLARFVCTGSHETWNH